MSMVGKATVLVIVVGLRGSLCSVHRHKVFSTKTDGLPLSIDGCGAASISCVFDSRWPRTRCQVDRPSPFF
eukprot:scaffold10837_cov70-Cyclotella_meneghiniana.AAC.1